MGRTKGVKNVKEPRVEIVHTPITLLPVDFPSESLNNMASKINEIIIKLNHENR